MARGQDGLEVKSKIDLMLIKKDMLRYVQDVMAMSCLKKTKDGERCVGCLNGVKYLKM